MQRQKPLSCGRAVFCLLLLFCLLVSLSSPVHAAQSYAGDQAGNLTGNHFNVVIALDGSGSMHSTDPAGYRYEAIGQFVYLLTEQGNVVGSVVFSDAISATTPMTALDSREAKHSAIQALQDAPVSGWTNTGAALQCALDMLSQGDAALPSVILLLSDGNTELATQEETDASLETKAEAIDAARQQGVAIYTVVLNANGEADVSEMEQISQATGGVCSEVQQAEDLTDVFSMFYNLIYDTGSAELVDEAFPDSGVLETSFSVPGIGVEEINILIYGDAISQNLYRPDGSLSQAEAIYGTHYTLIKEPDVVPGLWTLHTEGVPGDHIVVRMVFNTDLHLELRMQPEERTFASDQTCTFTASLRSGSVRATTQQQYTGFTATLTLQNAYGESIQTEPMQLQDSGFVLSTQLAPGVYCAQASVTGYTDRVSEALGPFTITEPAQPEIPENHAPVPVDGDTHTYLVHIWPFRGGSLQVDLSTLATDPDGDTLRYTIDSSSFLPDTDYTLQDDVLTMDHFSLKKGGFTVRATDPGGLFCLMELTVHTRSVALMTFIGLCILALLVAIALGIGLYIALTRPFRGRIAVSAGYAAPITLEPHRGRLRLDRFRGLADCGIAYQRAYFQATGENYIFLVSQQPFSYGGRSTQKLRIDSGQPVEIRASVEDPRSLKIVFTSRVRTRRGARTQQAGSRYARSAAQTPRRKL